MDAATADPAVRTARQFVIFHVDGEAFAVVLSEVKEIIRMPEIVHLPLAPPSLEGLANLRGSVLPIVNARCLFGLADVAHDEATRVVILDHGQPVGLVVDRMANVVTVEPEQIEGAERISTTLDTDMLRGVIKGIAETGMVMILDARGLIEREFAMLSAARTSGLAEKLVEAEGQAQTTRPKVEESQLVSFEVAGQEYGIEIRNVQEIVQVPEHITKVPRSSSAVLGMMNLRNRLLPVVSLRGLFGLEPAPIGEQNRVVVVTLAGGAQSVGVVMDRVKEVLRVSHSVIDPMPAYLSGDQGLREITSVCRLDGGKHIVSILDAEAMFAHETLREALGDADDTGASAMSASVRATEEEQFVVFRLMEEEYGVAISAVQEIVRLPETITRVPRSPAFIEGVINLRGTVIPLVDQRTLFGLPGGERNDRQRIVVFTIRGTRTGFIVDSVSEVMRISRALIGPAPELSGEQARIIRRVANLAEQKRMILLVDSDELLEANELSALNRKAA